MHKCTTLTCQYSCKIFSRKKSNRDTVQKQHTNKLNRLRPFYLLSIRSKKIDSSEFHKQIQDFELPTSWDFFWWGKKSGETLPKRIAHSSNTSRPFHLLSLRSKKNYSSELHKQIHDFWSVHSFHFFSEEEKEQGKIT